MTRIITFVLAIFFLAFNSSCADDELVLNPDEELFYYYRGDQQLLGPVSGNYVVVGFDTEVSKSTISGLFIDHKQFHPVTDAAIQQLTNHSHQLVVLKLKQPVPASKISVLLEVLNRKTEIAFAHPTTEHTSCTDIHGEAIGEKCIRSYSNFLYVRLNNSENQQPINSIAQQTKTTVIGQNVLAPNWFTLSVDKTATKDALQLANTISEEYGLLAEPDIIELPVVVPTITDFGINGLLVADMNCRIPLR